MDKKRKQEKITNENNKSFVEDGLPSEEILKTIKIIREYIEKGGKVSHEDRVKKLELDHEFFKNRYPILFDLATRPEPFKYEYLNYFLSMREKIITDKISSEDASVQVGKEWFGKFVDVSKMDKK